MKKSILLLMQIFALIFTWSIINKANACSIPNTSGTAGVVATNSTPPGYITDIIANGTNILSVGYKPTGGTVTFSNVALSSAAGLTVTGSWHGTKITTLNTIGCGGGLICLKINGTEGTFTFESGSGLTASYTWGTGGVSQIKGIGGDTLEFQGYSSVAASPVTRSPKLFGTCKVNPNYTFNSSNQIVLTATAIDATSVEFFFDNVSVATDSSPPFEFNTGVLASNHYFGAKANFAGGSIVSVMNYPTYMPTVSSGAFHTCATWKGDAYCWGEGANGKLGAGLFDTNDYSTPHLVLDISATQSDGYNVLKVSTYDEGACALKENGAVYCWGENSYGILGEDPLTNPFIEVPMLVASPGQNIVDITTGDDFACWLNTNGRVKCWGRGSQGQMGNGTTTTINLNHITAINSGAVKIEAGGQTVCAVMNNGDLKCWGYSNRGQVGNGSVSRSTSPVTVLSGNVTDVTVGQQNVCAVQNSQTYCWGDNKWGQLGNGTSTTNTTTTPILASQFSTILNPVSISTGYGITCVSSTLGVASCVGYNQDGQMGNSTSGSNQLTKVNVSTTNTSTINADEYTVCSFSEGHIKCWGDNTINQIGNLSATNPQLTPITVTGF